MSSSPDPSILDVSDTFARRHIGPSESEQAEMLATLGVASLDALSDQTVPTAIRLGRPLRINRHASDANAPEAPRGEAELLAELRAIASENKVARSYLGAGYYDCIVPPVIQRNILENPGWYTQYTPYQAEISQGRLEALLNFQTVVSDLTGLALAGASLLDEGTAAAEAMAMCFSVAGGHGQPRDTFFVSSDCHPQTLSVVETRAEALGVKVATGDASELDKILTHEPHLCGVLLQYPATDGRVTDLRALCERIHTAGSLVVVATDLLALALLTPPGEFGADIAVGNSQRFGVPMGFGGPHAAFIATKSEHARRMPGRIIGVSRDAHGAVAYRMAIQTREQHIRRERATSNICTAQALLAIMAGMYAVYHGPAGIERIARRVHAYAKVFAEGVRRLGHAVMHESFFDTVRVTPSAGTAKQILDEAARRLINLRDFGDGTLGVAFDETTSRADVHTLFEVFHPRAAHAPVAFTADALLAEASLGFAPELTRTSKYLTHAVFEHYHSETLMLRYIHKLMGRDLSLTHSMIPLGSCTMKLNATSEMLPVTWAEFGRMHPFAPTEQARGYHRVFADLERWLAEITGFAAVSLQPNAGSQGEFAGLMAIRAYHQSRGDHHRDVCLIPDSAHGTNPASAAVAGMKVVAVKCDARGNIDLGDLEKRAAENAQSLAALMVTYPSTHGVFEEGIRELCEIVHRHGGQVYMDGANLNAQVGLCRPGDIGADVCHMNLHKTFCLAAGTRVALADGVARPIEELVRDEQVYAWSEGEAGVRSAALDAVFRTGRKPCVEVTLEDGRTIVCTPDHRVLTTDGWVEAGHLAAANHRVVVGPETPLDDPNADADAERRYLGAYGPVELSMQTPGGRARTLAFFRLLGAACSDGTYSEDAREGRRTIRLYFGTRQDARKAVEDVALLTGSRPTLSTSNDIFCVRLPAALVRAMEGVPGLGEPGKRVTSSRTVPDLISDPQTPRAIVREFLGGLFGGDGCAPSILYSEKNPATLKAIRFVQSRSRKDVLLGLLHQLCGALARLGVEAYPDRSLRDVSPDGADTEAGARWAGGLTVVDGMAFAERVGFRYCAHKAARLSAAAAWWRMKRTIKDQTVAVAQRTLDRVASQAVHFQGPVPLWKPAVAQVYQEVSAEQVVLNPYYTSLDGFDRVGKQHLLNIVHGQQGKRQDLRGLRRTHRSIVASPRGRGGTTTGVPGIEDFLSSIGARAWFNEHTPGGGGYTVTYATASRDEAVEPTFNLRVVAVRPVGEREVYDLTVADLHSFLANGVVVHNCIPHGGGGPGMGPIAVAKHLAPFLPGNPVVEPSTRGERSFGAISAAPYGSPSILTISWVYIALMGAEGLKRATQVAILNANYMAKRLEAHYPVLFTGREGRVAHEFIIDLRPFEKTAGIKAEDVAKRLMDYGFHAPTMSFPVPGTLMIEPTESESKAELDRLCDALISIREEIRAIEEGRMHRTDNPLRNAPHTAHALAGEWAHPYTREQAAWPAPWLKDSKFWPVVGRIDNPWGDRNLVCTCPPMSEYAV